MTLLKVEQLTKFYKEQAAIQNVNFSFEHGKCVALIGPNGAGKTTILRTLAGVLKPTSGSISLSGLSTKEDRRSRIGYLPQYPQFPSWMTGKEFLIFSGKLAHLPKQVAEKRADELLAQMNLTDSGHKRIKTYSGGMKQRLGIAQAIIHEPKLLIMDEPVSSLDPLGRREVLNLMEQLKQQMAILFATHILSDAEEICDELLLLHEGKMIEAGSLTTLRKKYQTTAIELEFEHDLSKYQQKIDQLPSVVTSTRQQNKLVVTVTNLAEARHAILSRAVNEHWALLNFSINKTSLEDLFMKVVKT